MNEYRIVKNVKAGFDHGVDRFIGINGTVKPDIPDMKFFKNCLTVIHDLDIIIFFSGLYDTAALRKRTVFFMADDHKVLVLLKGEGIRELLRKSDIQILAEQWFAGLITKNTGQTLDIGIEHFVNMFKSIGQIVENYLHIQ